MAEQTLRHNDENKMRQAMRRAGEMAARETRSIVEERHLNDRAADRFHEYGETINVVRERIPNGSRIGNYLGDLVKQTEDVSKCIQNGDYRGAVNETRRFAADHPELFLPLALGIGCYAGRVVREMGRQAKGGEKTGSEPSTGVSAMETGARSETYKGGL